MQLTGCGMFLHWKPIVWMLRLTKVLNDSFRKCISKLYKGKRWGDAHIFIGMFYRRTVFLTLVPIWNDKYGQISTMHLYKVDTLILLLSVWRRFSLFLANRSSWHFLVHPKCYVKHYMGGKNITLILIVLVIICVEPLAIDRHVLLYRIVWVLNCMNLSMTWKSKPGHLQLVTIYIFQRVGWGICNTFSWRDGSSSVGRSLQARRENLSLVEDIPILTYSHKTKRIRSELQVAKTRLLYRDSGLTLSNTVAEVDWAPYTSHWEGPWDIDQEELESVAGNREVWTDLLILMAPRPSPGKSAERNKDWLAG